MERNTHGNEKDGKAVLDAVGTPPKRQKSLSVANDQQTDAHALASNQDASVSSPTKLTSLRTSLAFSEDLRSNETVGKPEAKRSARRVNFKGFQKPESAVTEDTAVYERLGPLTISWISDNTEKLEVTISDNIHRRIHSSFEGSSKSFRIQVSSYLRRKFLEAKECRGLFSVHRTFYVVFRELFGATHELFADAINASGILPYFCSLDGADVLLGSAGSWKDVEESVVAAVGNPPLNDEFVKDVVKTCEENVRKLNPYLRIVLLPFNDGSFLKERCDEIDFYGEVIAVFEPETFSFIHQMDFFRKESERSGKEWRPTVELALVVWVNEVYRIWNPVAADIDDCFTLWADEYCGDASCINFKAIWRAFPPSCRKLDTKVASLEQILNYASREFP